MSDLGSELFRKYGVGAIVAVVVAAIAVWGLAHWTAAPGKEVSVLWGLVNYTKRMPSPDARVSAPPSVSSQADRAVRQGSDSGSATESVLGQLNLTVKNGVSPENYETVLNKLRSQRGLIELTETQSNKQTAELPVGTYFFLFWHYINVTPPYQDAETKIGWGVASRYKKRPDYFEIQKTADGRTDLIVFVNEIHAAEISVLSGTATHTVIAAGSPWGQMTSLVCIPVQRIQSSRVRDLQSSKQHEITVADLTVK